MIRTHCIKGAKECLPLVGIAVRLSSEMLESKPTHFITITTLRDKEIPNLESGITGEIVKGTFSC